MSIYQSIYDIISTYIYGGVDLTADMSLICTMMSTIGSVFCFSIPFIIAVKFIKMVTGG